MTTMEILTEDCKLNIIPEPFSFMTLSSVVAGSQLIRG